MFQETEENYSKLYGIREHRFSKAKAQRNARGNERQSQGKNRKDIKPKPKLEGKSQPGGKLGFDL